MQKLFNKFLKKNLNITNNHSLVEFNNNPFWMKRSYAQFADEAYSKNVIVHQAIKMIASNAASIPFRYYLNQQLIDNHDIIQLINHPNPQQNKESFLENIISNYLISGNAYIQIIYDGNDNIVELYSLRPDRITIEAGDNSLPKAYRYQIDDKEYVFPVNMLNGYSNIIHIKSFHPLDDWYGLSPIEAAAFAIDQHNNAAQWNQALLKNSARPSGAIVVTNSNDSVNYLSESEYQRLKFELQEYYSGLNNAGKPLLLQGGLEWRSMGLSPKDMDFNESKNSAAREIALAFGIPPQLLGIPGDNTYSNLAEARQALWEQTLIPLLKNIISSFNNKLLPLIDSNLKISMNTENISALALKKEKTWERISNAEFMTINEKRQAVGLDPIEEGDNLPNNI